MWRQRWLGVGCVALCCALSEPVQAQPGSVSASFEGTVQATQLPLGFTPPHLESYYDGALIVGSFEFELSNPQQVDADGSGYFTDPAGLLKLSYTVLGQTFAYQVGLSATPDAPVILLQPANPGMLQSVTLLTSFMPKYEGATVELTGPHLFNGLDAHSIDFSSGHPRLATSFASASAEMLFSVDVHRVAYSGTPSPVSEPSTVLLLMLGGLAMLCRRVYVGRAGVVAA
jgi:hypothetical protein